MKSRSAANARAFFRASVFAVRLKPACAWSAPQQVCARGTRTSQPASTSSRTASRFTSGNITSITQVLKNPTRARGLPAG